MVTSNLKVRARLAQPPAALTGRAPCRCAGGLCRPPPPRRPAACRPEGPVPRNHTATTLPAGMPAGPSTRPPPWARRSHASTSRTTAHRPRPPPRCASTGAAAEAQRRAGAVPSASGGGLHARLLAGHAIRSGPGPPWAIPGCSLRGARLARLEQHRSASRRTRTGRPGRQLANPPHPNRRAPAQSDGGSRRPRSSTSAVLDAIKRSPLNLDLPNNHPGLAAVADLVRPRGRRRAERSGGDGPATCRVVGAIWANGAHSTRRARLSAASRRPLPSLQSEDDISAAVVALVREHGLLDAKAMVASDVTVRARVSTWACLQACTARARARRRCSAARIKGPHWYPRIMLRPPPGHQVLHGLLQHPGQQRRAAAQGGSSQRTGGQLKAAAHALKLVLSVARG